MHLVVAALLLLPPLVPAAEPCPVSRHLERSQSDYWVVVDGRYCEDDSGASHAERVLVTRGPPADNRSDTVAEANLRHARSGDPSGPSTVREHANASYEGHRVNAWYNSTRDPGGATGCTLHANATHPRGSLVARRSLPGCAPHEVLLP